MKARFKQALCILFGTMLICTAQVAAYTEDSTEYSEEVSPQYVEIVSVLASLSIDEDSLQLRRFVVFLRPSQSWVNILRQLRLTLDITIVGNLPASKSNFAFDILSILIGNGQP